MSRNQCILKVLFAHRSNHQRRPLSRTHHHRSALRLLEKLVRLPRQLTRRYLSKLHTPSPSNTDPPPPSAKHAEYKPSCFEHHRIHGTLQSEADILANQSLEAS